MAPAAKERIKGKIILIFTTSIAPTTAEKGSTMPLKAPNKKDFKREKPSLLRGKLIAAPSGKFWIAIPKVKAIAPYKLEFAKEPKATPIAKPSGILWSVIELNNKKQRLTLVDSSLFNNKWEAIRLPKYKVKAPIIKPTNTINQVKRFNSLDNFIAGFNKEKNDAASMIPADNDNMEFIKFLWTDLKKKIKEEPKIVTKKVIVPATKDWIIALWNEKKELKNINLTNITYDKSKK